MEVEWSVKVSGSDEKRFDERSVFSDNIGSVAIYKLELPHAKIMNVFRVAVSFVVQQNFKNGVKLGHKPDNNILKF